MTSLVTSFVMFTCWATIALHGATGLTVNVKNSFVISGSDFNGNNSDGTMVIQQEQAQADEATREEGEDLRQEEREGNPGVMSEFYSVFNGQFYSKSTSDNDIYRLRLVPIRISKIWKKAVVYLELSKNKEVKLMQVVIPTLCNDKRDVCITTVGFKQKLSNPKGSLDVNELNHLDNEAFLNNGDCKSVVRRIAPLAFTGHWTDCFSSIHGERLVIKIYGVCTFITADPKGPGTTLEFSVAERNADISLVYPQMPGQYLAGHECPAYHHLR